MPARVLTRAQPQLRLHTLQLVQQSADAARTDFRTLWARLFRMMRLDIDRRALRRALRQGERLAMLQLVADAQERTINQEGRALLLVLVMRVMVQAAEAVLPTLIRRMPAPPRFRYLAHLPEVTQAAAHGVSQQLGMIQDTTMHAWRIATQTLPATLSIEVIGVTPRQVLTLARKQAEWQAEGVPRIRQRFRLRGLVQEALQRRIEQAALTQSMMAANLGQHQLWEQAERSGFLDMTQWQRAWRTAIDERRCPRCRPMHGQRRGLHEPFVLRDGTTVLHPPAHVACRCVATLVQVQEART